MSLTEVVGDLFESQDALAHCIAADYWMAAGIAVEFVKRFGRPQKPVHVGGVTAQRVGDRFVFGLVTKERSCLKPTYESLETALHSLRGECLFHGVKRVSMPRIGCGLDRLEWIRVRHMIRSVLHDIHVTVYRLP
jgi:O-acetyl-ADP-ribose deacetylase (regulator of RNase III)